MINKLKDHKGFIKYSKNTSWLFAERILRIVVSLFVGIWIARYLGPEQYGLFSYALSFVGLFAAFATLGLDGIVVRELVKNESKVKEIIGTAFYLKLLGAIGVLLFLAIAINFTSNDRYTNILIFIIASAIIFQSFNVVDFYFQSKVMSKFVVYANIVSLFISSIVKIVLLLNEAPLIAFVWVVLFDSIILAIGFLYFFLKTSNFNLRDIKFKKEIAINLLKDSWPLIFSGVVIAIYMRIDQVMIKEMLDIGDVGQYAAAVRISEAWYFIPMLLGSSFYPAIVNAKKTNEKLYYSRLQNFYTFMVWLGIIVAIPMTFLSNDIINLLYGSAFNEAGSVLMIHIWAGIFLSLGIACGKWYLTENYTKGALKKAIFGMVLNIMGNYILIPIYGIQGAAVSTLFGHLAANLIYDIFDHRVRGQLKYKMRAFLPIYLLRKIRNEKI
ncbi:MAG: flippase [Arcobacteraceae bacterium]|nr:flippase [Arcobacteraceae bacterium]